MGDEQAPKATPRLSKMEVKDVLETQEEIQEVQVIFLQFKTNNR